MGHLLLGQDFLMRKRFIFGKKYNESNRHIDTRRRIAYTQMRQMLQETRAASEARP
jgi:hypothetical protein